MRQYVGDLIRKEPRAESSQAGVLTVTGLLPRPLDAPKVQATDPATPEAQADEIITDLFRHTRYLLSESQP